MQVSIIASLFIVLIAFESKSSGTEEGTAGYTEINIEIEKYLTNNENIKPPIPNNPDIHNSQTNNNIKLSGNGFEGISFKIDQHAEFIGGDGALRTYLIEQKQYSDEAKKKDIQGRVNISFVIDKNGKVQDPKVIRSIHPLIDTEALRLINTMPDWSPAELKGEPVESKQILPIIFINNK